MKKIRLFEISLLIGFLVAIVFSITSFAGTCEEIRGDVLRLHVLANSDAKEDQQLKLKVRDALLEAGKNIFDGSVTKENAEEKIEDEKHDDEKKVDENGSSTEKDEDELIDVNTTNSIDDDIDDADEDEDEKDSKDKEDDEDLKDQKEDDDKKSDDKEENDEEDEDKDKKSDDEDKKEMRTLEEEILSEYDIKRWEKKTKRYKEVYK